MLVSASLQVADRPAPLLVLVKLDFDNQQLTAFQPLPHMKRNQSDNKHTYPLYH